MSLRLRSAVPSRSWSGMRREHGEDIQPSRKPRTRIANRFAHLPEMLHNRAGLRLPTNENRAIFGHEFGLKLTAEERKQLIGLVFQQTLESLARCSELLDTLLRLLTQASQSPCFGCSSTAMSRSLSRSTSGRR